MKYLRSVWLFGTVLLIGWGIGAFGCVYEWGYNPLLAGSVVLGVVGVTLRRPSRTHFALVLSCFALIALVIAAQLIPIAEAWLRILSPAGLELVRRQSLIASLGNSFTHPISIAPHRTAIGLLFFLSFATLTVGTATALTNKSSLRLIESIAALGFVFAILAIVQRATSSGLIYGFWRPDMGLDPFGPFVNRNHFAGWMLMTIPTTVGLLALRLSQVRRTTRSDLKGHLITWSTPEASQAIACGFALVVMSLSVVLSMSRSGMIALAAGLVVMGLQVRKRVPQSRFVAITLLLSSVLAVAWVGADKVFARFVDTDAVDLSSRVAIWTDTLAIIKDFWLTGSGLNTYGVATLYYQKSLPDVHLEEAHSDHLQLLADGGVILAIAVACSISVLGWSIRERSRSDALRYRSIRLGAVSALLAIAIQSLVEFSLQIPGNAALFAVLLGVALHDGRSTAVAREALDETPATQPSVMK